MTMIMNVEQLAEWELARETEISEKTHFSTTLCTTNPLWRDLELNPSCYGGKRANNPKVWHSQNFFSLSKCVHPALHLLIHISADTDCKHNITRTDNTVFVKMFVKSKNDSYTNITTTKSLKTVLALPCLFSCLCPCNNLKTLNRC